MWAQQTDDTFTLIQGPRSIVGATGTTHPANIFMVWSAEDLAAIGVYPATYVSQIDRTTHSLTGHTFELVDGTVQVTEVGEYSADLERAHKLARLHTLAEGKVAVLSAQTDTQKLHQLAKATMALYQMLARLHPEEPEIAALAPLYQGAQKIVAIREYEASLEAALTSDPSIVDVESGWPDEE